MLIFTLILVLSFVISFSTIIYLKFLRNSRELKYISRFEHLMMSISTDFIQQKSENIDNSINLTLKAIGEFFDADRSYIFLFTEEENMDNTHEWCAKDVTPQLENLQGIPQNILPWWMNKINNNIPIYIPYVSKMPPEASEEKAILEPQGVISLIVLPLNIEKKAIGFIGFDFTRKSIKINDNILNTLRIVGEIIVNALERKRYENSLNAEKNFALQIMKNMGQGLTITNQERKFEYVNPAFSNFMGYTPEELIGKTPYDITSKEGFTILDSVAGERKQGKSGSYETNLVKKDGTLIPVMITGVPRTKNDKIIGTIAVVTDLSQIKKMENSLRIARDKALDASRLKSQFLANMSHEIRTPMVSIIGMLDILKDTDLNNEQKEYVNTANTSANHLLELINDILDYSKLEANQLKMEKIRFNIFELLTNIYNSFAEQFKKKDLKLILETDKNCPKYLLGDTFRLSQVLYNLIGNAFKFTEKGYVKIQLLLNGIDEKKQETKISIKVIDTGIGIKEEFMSSIFQSFQQEDGSITRRFGGTGLGLCISKNIINAMGGDIEVDSEYNFGSVFTINLKMEIAQSQEESKKINESKNEENIQKLNILLVEDNSANQKVISLFLSQRGWTYTIASNGLEGYSAFIKGQFDIVLMDMQMPVMSGLEATKKIRQWEEENNKKRTLIFALSADSQKESKEECIMEGIDLYLTKPIKKEELYKNIEENFKNNIHNDTNFQKEHMYIDSFNVQNKMNELSVDEEEMKILVEDFLKTTELTLSEIESTYKYKEYEELAKKVHLLKSSVGFFADKKTYNQLVTIEKEIKLEKYEEIEENLKSFKSNIIRIIKIYVEHFNQSR